MIRWRFGARSYNSDRFLRDVGFSSGFVGGTLAFDGCALRRGIVGILCRWPRRFLLVVSWPLACCLGGFTAARQPYYQHHERPTLGCVWPHSGTLACRRREYHVWTGVALVHRAGKLGAPGRCWASGSGFKLGEATSVTEYLNPYRFGRFVLAPEVRVISVGFRSLKGAQNWTAAREGCHLCSCCGQFDA